MKKGILFLAILVCSLPTFSQQRGARTGADSRAAAESSPVSTLPIRRVILYSNGVAYIERRGFVTGDAEINLAFKQSQVDDVLKSMIVLDLGQGRIGAVSYNSSMPASARTAEIPFSVDARSEDGGGIAEILSQMQGEQVSVTSSKGAASGAILTIETRKSAKETEKSLSSSYFLVIASDAGEIINFDLADVKSVKLLDQGPRSDLTEFSGATASTRRRDAKTISVTSHGSGQREMVVSYTVSAPIWKTTYRVVLDSEGQPFFQGWAIVDNVSEEDWNDVQLSLVSGSPVSFIQNLQKPLFRYRPIIPIPDDLNLDPQIYDAEERFGYGSGNGSGTGSGSGSGYGSGQGISAAVEITSDFKVETSISNALVSQQSGVQTAATGSELGDLFEYKIDNPVTVLRNRSALIPIVQTRMEGERVSIYNESVRKDRPMGGMMLENTTPLTFEGGSMTVLDRDAYAGESLMERLKPKERRLISFALDLGTRVSSESNDDVQPVQLIKVVDGVFQAHYFRHEEKYYNVTNQTDRKKIVYIEHPVRKSWSLTDNSAKPEVVTEQYYRFRVELEPFGKVKLQVIERQGLMDIYRLSSLTLDQLNLFISRKYIDEPTRSRLEKLIDLRSQINQDGLKLKALESEEDRISTDQKRFRENIEALAKTSEAKQLIARYIAKANEQESRLEQIEKDKKALITEKERLEGELANEIKNFEIR